VSFSLEWRNTRDETISFLSFCLLLEELASWGTAVVKLKDA
jgi:hypothetical protein